jgi:predicted ribosome quality control (RQC) complex YloA/Tae2 family protein
MFAISVLFPYQAYPEIILKRRIAFKLAGDLWYNRHMAFDGIVTYAITKELSDTLTLGKIEKVYQPGVSEILLQIHTQNGNYRLFASAGTNSARVCLTGRKYQNPDAPPNFCMLLRKHIQGGRITEFRQHGSDRVIEMDIECQTELGFDVSRRLIFEIMGKHSNIALIDIESGKIIDSIKRISIDVNRYRQLLPGITYVYPPEQDKTGFREVANDYASGKDLHEEISPEFESIMDHVSGISPAIARELEDPERSPASRLSQIVKSVEDDSYTPVIYSKQDGSPKEFHLIPLTEFEEAADEAGRPKYTVRHFDTLNECVEEFFAGREISNLVKQKAMPLQKSVRAALDKAFLKKQRLGDDLLKAEDSEKYKLYGELLTANLHAFKQGDKSVTVTNYYDGSEVEIVLDEKIPPSLNAQKYYKRYSKAKTAIIEKTAQLEETGRDIEYLESVLLNVDNANTEDEIEQIRDELVQTGYVRYRAKPGFKRKKQKPSPLKYTLSNGMEVYAGRNNKENDYLTMTFAKKTDIWFHTKDIPGSHIILKLPEGMSVTDLTEETIYEAASIAAWHSKAKDSENVPVDFVPVRHVKKPNGAKPGMVIFTHNTTVYVTPKLP